MVVRCRTTEMRTTEKNSSTSLTDIMIDERDGNTGKETESVQWCKAVFFITGPVINMGPIIVKLSQTPSVFFPLFLIRIFFYINFKYFD